MAIDILHEPPTHAAQVDTTKMKSTAALNEPTNIHWDEMQAKVNLFVSELKTEYSDLPDYQLELIGDLYGGGYRLERHAEFQDGQDEQMETSARIQQNQAHAMLFAAFGTASPAYRQEMCKRVEIFDSISNSETGRAEKFNAFWGGVRSEAAALAILNKLGYRVFLPDYAQDPYEVTWENNEVLQWDIKSGVDLVALRKDGIVLLVDSKSENMMENEKGDLVVRETAEVRVGKSCKEPGGLQMNRLPQTLREFVTSLAPTDVRRMRLTLPTNSGCFVDNSAAKSDQEFLQNFITQRSYIGDYIAERLGHKRRE